MKQNERSDGRLKMFKHRCQEEKICCCRGPQGEQGPAGKTPTVTVGKTETLPPGSQAEVMAVQTTDGVELNFGIPQGEQGPAGKTPTVTVGKTETLPPGSQAEVTAVQTADGVELDFGIPQGEAGEAAKDVFASFAAFEVRFSNGQLIPLATATDDTTGNITLQDNTRIVLKPGYYYIAYSVSAVLDTPGYMQITPSYNGTSHLEYGIYFKTNTASSSAYGTGNIIIYVPSQTNFTLTYNSNVQSRSGAATVSVIKLNR